MIFDRKCDLNAWKNFFNTGNRTFFLKTQASTVLSCACSHVTYFATSLFSTLKIPIHFLPKSISSIFLECAISPSKNLRFSTSKFHQFCHSKAFPLIFCSFPTMIPPNKLGANPCQDYSLHDCDPVAECDSGDHPGHFQCKCPAGYVDISPDRTQKPGRKCKRGGKRLARVRSRVSSFGVDRNWHGAASASCLPPNRVFFFFGLISRLPYSFF